METDKVIDNYVKICEFLLSQVASTPVGTHMDVNLNKFVGHYSSIEIEHMPKYKAFVRMYDSPNTHDHFSQNYFYVGDNLKTIRKTIFKDCPTLDFMKNLVIGWHRYGIKELILSNLRAAVAEANEKLEAEKEIDNFVV